MAVSLRKKGAKDWKQYNAAEATALYKSGNYEIAADKEVAVHTPEGLMWAKPEAEGFSDNFQGFAEPQEVMDAKQKARDEKYANTQLEAAALGALAGPTFGGSTAIAGLIAPERTREVKARNPWTYGLAEATTSLLTAAPAALATRALTKGTTAIAAKVLSKEIAERAVSKGVTAIAAETAAREVSERVGSALASTAVGAVEGTAYGAGNYTAETVLGNTDATAEGALKHMGGMAALGGITGGVADAAIGAISASRAAKAAKKAVAPPIPKVTKEGIQRNIAKSMNMQLDDTIAEAAANAINKADELPAKITLKDIFLDKNVRKHIMHGESYAKNGAREMADDLDESLKAGDVLDKYTRSKLRVSAMRKQIPKENWESTFTQATNMADDLEKRGAQFLSVRETAGKLKKALEAAPEASNPKAAVFEAMYDAKRAIQKVGKRADGDLKYLTDDVSASFNNHLRDVDTYGGMAKFQQKVDPLISAYIENRKVLRGKFLTKSGEKAGYESLYVTNPASVTNFIKRYGTEGKEIAEQVLRREMDLRKQLNEAFGNMIELPDADKALINQSNAAMERMTKKLEHVGRSLGAYNQAKELTKRGGLLDMVGMGVAGITGGWVGAAAQRLVNAPDLALRALSHLDGVTVEGQSKMASRVIDWVQGTAQKTKRAAISGAKAGARAATRRIPLTSYDRISQRVFEASNTPDRTIDNLQEQSPSLAAAPETASKAATRVNEGVAYLASQIPPATLKQMTEPSLLKKRADVPDFEKDKFLRLIDVMNDPEVAIDRMEDGNLTREEVKMLKIVYPETYNLMVKSALAGIVDADEKGKPMSYQKKIQLGTLLGAPLDETMSPEFMAAIAQAQAPSAPEQGPPPVSTSIKSDKLSEMYGTSTSQGLDSYSRR